MVKVAKVDDVSEMVGSTAGKIWAFLDQNESYGVSKMVKVLQIEDKWVQRGIGWLALEGKVFISIVNRAETITLIRE